MTAQTGLFDEPAGFEEEPPPEDEWAGSYDDGWDPALEDDRDAVAVDHGPGMVIDPADTSDPGPVEPGHGRDMTSPVVLDTTVDLSGLCDGMNPAQDEAVRHTDGPMLVVAGPGSGKTRVLTHRIAALVAQGCPPERILAVTFTNKAAGEMRERLTGLVGDKVADTVWAATFHAMCARMLRRHAPAAGLRRDFLILDSDEPKAIIKDLLGQMAGDGRKPPAEDVRAVTGLISNAANRLHTVDQLAAEPNPFAPIAAQIWVRYQEHKAAIGAVDFDDLLVLTLRMFRNNPQLAQRYAARFAYVLVDEYQDTNAPQYQLTRLLASAWRNLCAVGDDRQAIYAFRAATPEGLRAFDTDYPDAKIVHLAQNYRSTKHIVAVAQALIAPDRDPNEPALWTDNDAGASVVVRDCHDGDTEARWVADQIESELAAGVANQEIAILYRTNAQSRGFERELSLRGVKTTVVGALRFYERAEVRDVLAYLRCLVRDDDVMAIRRAGGVPKRGLGATGLNNVLADAADAGLGALTHARAAHVAGTGLGRSKAGWGKFLADVDAVTAAAASGGPVAAIETVLDLPGFQSAVLDRGGEKPESRLENLAELVNEATRFTIDGTWTTQTATADDVADDTEMTVPVDTLDGLDQVRAYLDHVSLLTDVSDEGVPDGVQLMTSHTAKGKEFDVVFCVGWEDGYYPHQRAESPADISEERRLAFVAASRARHRLRISHASGRFLFGNFDVRFPSPFLDDLPAAHIKMTSDEIDGEASRSGAAAFRSSNRGNSGPGRRGHAGAGKSWPGPSAPARPRSSGSVPTVTRRTRPPGNALTGPAGPPARKPDPGPRVAADKIASGSRVRHLTHGDGTVVDISGDQVTVVFDDQARRVLLITFAPLELL